MSVDAYYILVEGRFYTGDIEGVRYHWKQGIPGSRQLMSDLEKGNKVNFIYYRTWSKENKSGKYFYGHGNFDNKSLQNIKINDGGIDYLCGIAQYGRFVVPIYIEDSLRKSIWPGANRQAGIKKISSEIFEKIKRRGMDSSHISGLAVLVGENNLEELLNNQISVDEFKDTEAKKAVKRVIKTEVFKRTQRIIKKLKKQYKGMCQITGEKIISSRIFNVDVTEAHHIQYLSKDGTDDDPTNIIILSPEWHRLIHKENPKFDSGTCEFIFKDGQRLKVKYQGHLSKNYEKKDQRSN